MANILVDHSQNSGLIFEYKNKLQVGLYRTAQSKLIFHF